MTNYYEVKAIDSDGDATVLYGSFDRNDCTGELLEERSNWKEEGYSRFGIHTRTTTETPDPTVYPSFKVHTYTTVDINDTLTVSDETGTPVAVCTFDWDDECVVIKHNNYTDTYTELFDATPRQITEFIIVLLNEETICNKRNLFRSQAPSFNFEKSADELLEHALAVCYVRAIPNTEDLYEINPQYGKNESCNHDA